MLDQIIINIINNTDETDEEDRIRYYSPSVNYMGQLFSITDISPVPGEMSFFSENDTEPGPIEFSEQKPHPGHAGGETYPVTVTIDPGYSFGDGRHATTWLCVKYLIEHLADVPGADRAGLSLLDAGTGTGVLSIIAAKLGIIDIDAVDIYHHAIQCAAKNRSENNCDQIRLHESDLASFKTDRTYDIVMANLVSDVISANLERLMGLTAPGGTIIASGVSAGKSEFMLHLFQQAGLQVIDHTHRDGWYGFLLRRSQAAAFNWG